MRAALWFANVKVNFMRSLADRLIGLPLVPMVFRVMHEYFEKLGQPLAN